MKTYGAIIKQIRKGKSISQIELSNTILSRTTISKIENNNIVPTINTLEAILHKLDVTVDEFQFIRNGYKLNPRELIIADFFKLVSNTQTEKINSIIYRCNIHLTHKPTDILISDVRIILKASLHLSNNETLVAQKLVTPVWERLKKMDHFSLIELRLVTNILFYFPVDIVQEFFPRLVNTINKYISFDNTIITLKLALLINTATLFLLNNPKSTLENLEEAIKIAKEINRFDFLAYAYYLKGINTNNPSLVAKAEAIFIAIEKEDILHQLESNFK
ncbi:helix-turn-helix transcriptional regulator [Listeria monocytogenes]|uniref:Helix-turn-helix transcriptional regulator n=1 Tax=Listeria monocytogenes TaxID=1639 RepID=A0A5Y9DP99_LISMN|nr:helix-turn-helix transcriptional regulator [Listeria monocytogenes]